MKCRHLSAVFKYMPTSIILSLAYVFVIQFVKDCGKSLKFYTSFADLT